MKFLKKNKKLIIAFVIISTLLELLLVGVVMNLVKLGDEVAAEEFGGETVLAVDFDKPSAVKNTSGINTDLSYGKVCAKVGTFTEGNGSFVYSVPKNTVNNGNGTDPYVNFAFDKSKVYLDEFSVYTMDFDFRVVKDNGSYVYFNIDYRNSNGSGLSNGEAQLVYQNGKLYLTYPTLTYIADCESDTFHITYVVNHEKTLIYINGKFLCEAPRSYNDGAEYATGFRMGIIGALDKSSDLEIALDNVVVNKFAPDYKGNIQKLFSNPDKLLKKNSDTIFGGAFKWPEE